MIAPLAPYAIRGAIFYQGESNLLRAYTYRRLFSIMIAGWRDDWGQGDFPFGFVQLAPFNCEGGGFADWGTTPEWCAELRESQLVTLKHVPTVA